MISEVEPVLAVCMIHALLAHLLLRQHIVNVMPIKEVLRVATERLAHLVHGFEEDECVIVGGVQVVDLPTDSADKSVLVLLLFIFRLAVYSASQEVNVVDQLFLADLADAVDGRLTDLGTQGKSHQAKRLIAKERRTIPSHGQEVGKKLTTGLSIFIRLLEVETTLVQCVTYEGTETIHAIC